MKTKDGVIGAMVTQSYFNSSLYSEKDIKLLEFISYQVATAIERKRSEEALWEKQQELAILFKNIPDALVYTDQKSNILYINPRFNEMFGYTIEEIKGKNIDCGIIHSQKYINEGKYYTAKSEKLFTSYESYRKRKDGKIFPVSISASPIKANDKVKGFIVLYQDITERKQNEKIQKVLYNISKAANSNISLKELYPIIHRELNNIIDATNIYIALVNKDKDELYFPYYIDKKDEKMPIVNFSTTNTLTTYVVKAGKSLLNSNKQYKEMVNQGILTPMGSSTNESI